jgi:hypothetical protein
MGTACQVGDLGNKGETWDWWSLRTSNVTFEGDGQDRESERAIRAIQVRRGLITIGTRTDKSDCTPRHPRQTCIDLY